MRIHHLFTASTIGLLLLAGAAHAETKIVYGSWAPTNDPISVGALAFFGEVKTRSGGSVSFEPHFDSTVIAQKTALPGIKDGLVDAGYMAGSIFRSELKVDYMMTQFATLSSTPHAMSAAVSETVLSNCPECLAELSKQNVIPMAYAGSSPFYLMCKNPITSVADLKGKSVRAASAYLRFVETVGGVPVNTPTTEVLDVMQRGQVSCLIGSMFWLQAYSLWDVVTWVADLPLGQYNNGMIMAMNKGKWAELSGADRKAIADSLPTFVKAASDESERQMAGVRKGAIDHGVKWGAPPQDFVDAFKKFQAGELEQILKNAKADGVPNAAGISAAFVKNVDKWNAKVGVVGRGDGYRAALVEDIFSKVKF